MESLRDESMKIRSTQHIYTFLIKIMVIVIISISCVFFLLSAFDRLHSQNNNKPYLITNMFPSPAPSVPIENCSVEHNNPFIGSISTQGNAVSGYFVGTVTHITVSLEDQPLFITVTSRDNTLSHTFNVQQIRKKLQELPSHILKISPDISVGDTLLISFQCFTDKQQDFYVFGISKGDH